MWGGAQMVTTVPGTVLVAVVYVSLLVAAFGAALDSFVYEMLPKNGCRAYHADGYDDPWSRVVVAETTIAADVPLMSNIESSDGRVTKSTVPYDGNPCDEAALDEYRTDDFVLVSYASTGGLGMTTVVLGAVALATIPLGWPAATLIVIGAVWLLSRGGRRAKPDAGGSRALRGDRAGPAFQDTPGGPA